MLRLLNRFRAAEAPPALPPAPAPQILPAELVASIQAASALPRGHPDPETGDIRVLVTMPGGAPFYWEGTDPAAERLARRFDLTPRQASRAAQLLARHLSSGNRVTVSRRQWREKRKSPDQEQ